MQFILQYSGPSKKNRTCIIHPHLHAIIPIKMNWVGHAFKGYMESDIRKSFTTELDCSWVYDNGMKGWVKLQNVCAEDTEKNMFIYWHPGYFSISKLIYYGVSKV